MTVRAHAVTAVPQARSTTDVPPADTRSHGERRAEDIAGRVMVISTMGMAGGMAGMGIGLGAKRLFELLAHTPHAPEPLALYVGGLVGMVGAMAGAVLLTNSLAHPSSS